MVNKVTLLGNVGHDPRTSNNTKDNNLVCSFTLATTERYTRDGEKVENVEWHRVVSFGNLAKLVSNNVRKGKQVYVEGKIHTRSYIDEHNQEVRVTEIVASDIKLCGKKES